MAEGTFSSESNISSHDSSSTGRNEKNSLKSYEYGNVPFKRIGAAELIAIGIYDFYGYIHIKTKTYFGLTWKRRFVIISHGYLYIYSDENAAKIIRCYSLRDVERVCQSAHYFCLEFKEVDMSPLEFMCELWGYKMEWITHIEEAMSGAKKYLEGDCALNNEGVIANESKPEHYRTEKPSLLRTKSEPTVIKGTAEWTAVGACQFNGYLYIKSQTFMGVKWKRRFVIIDGGYFSIYSTKNEQAIKDVYSFGDFERVIEEGKAPCFRLDFKEVNRLSLVCKCESYQNRQKWITRIEKTISDVQTNVQGDSGFESDGMMKAPAHRTSFGDYSFVNDLSENRSRLRTKSVPSAIEITSEQEDNQSSVSGVPLLTKDTARWLECLTNSLNFESTAKLLLSRGILPNNELFQSICKKYGRKSEIVRYICKGICGNIKEISNNIVKVWPAFQYKNYEQNNDAYIIFVVITKSEIYLETDYEVTQRTINEISSLNDKENCFIRDNENLSYVGIEDIKLCLRSNVNKMIENHKNLTWMTVSGIKSSGYGTKNHVVSKLSCIAFYVQIKGLIPIEEEPFETFLDGYPVDVREGVFTFYGKPTELCQNVRMGCALDSGYGTKQGTVGPFFRFETDPYTYLLTSAHVLLDPEQMEKLILDNKVHYGMFGTDTFQPPESISVENNSRNFLGKLEFAVYRKGGQFKPGMEVALVRIDKNRIPIHGKFPVDETNEFSVGGICGVSNPLLLKDPYVYKYGSVTGLRKGKIRFHGSSVKTNVLYGHSLGLDITLHEQMEVESVDGVPFGELGDSGSLVFRKDGDILTAIGIFEGKVNSTYMVTPIQDVMQALSEFMSLYRTPPNDTQMDIDEANSAVTMKLYFIPPTNNGSIAGEVNRNISEEIRKQTNDVQTNILHHTDHKIGSVKAELSAVRVHIESTKQEIIETLSGQISAISEAINKLHSQ